MTHPWTLAIHVEVDGAPLDGVHVRRLTGREVIGQPFTFDVEVVLERDTELADRARTGDLVCIVISQDGLEVRRIHGLLASVRDRLEPHGAMRSYRLRVVPRLAQLALVETQEVMLDLTLPEAIDRKLRMHGFGAEDFEMRLLGTYEKREIVVQFGESDLALVSRLAEHAGMSLVFEHEAGTDKVVLTDHPAGFTAVEDHEAIPFRADGESLDVFALEVVEELVPGRVFVQDYNHRTPLLDPTASHEADPEGMGGVVEYGSHVKSPEEAGRLAQIRAEEILAGKRVLEARSSTPILGAGRRFVLLDHPRLPPRQELLVTSIEHEAVLPVGSEARSADDGYRNRFTAIDHAVVFRPPRRTPRPRLPGVVTGVVQPGPEGEIGGVAKLTADGRYTVHLHFDTAAHRDERSSHPVRMAQPFAGHGNAMHFPLLPGTEVLIAFANGDPDRPVIVGALPNPVSPSAIVADEAHTHRIRSSQGVVFEFGQTVFGRS